MEHSRKSGSEVKTILSELVCTSSDSRCEVKTVSSERPLSTTFSTNDSRSEIDMDGISACDNISGVQC